MTKLFTSLLFAFIILFSFTSKADIDPKSGIITGTVKTSDSKPAAYVSVSLPQINKGTTTNDEGYFELRGIKPGTYTIKISFVGLKPLESTITVPAGAITRQN